MLMALVGKRWAIVSGNAAYKKYSAYPSVDFDGCFFEDVVKSLGLNYGSETLDQCNETKKSIEYAINITHGRHLEVVAIPLPQSHILLSFHPPTEDTSLKIINSSISNLL